MKRISTVINLAKNHVGGGGRSAIQIVNGTDVVTAGGGGGGADCKVEHFCGGGGKHQSIIDASSEV